MTNFSRDLRFRLAQGWQLWLLLVGLSVVFVGWILWSSVDAHRNYTAVSAKITGFGNRQDKWHPGWIWISAATSDGIVGEATVPSEQLKGCRVGDNVKAKRLGVTLKLLPAPCEGRSN